MSLRSLIATGTKVWLDSVDPAEVQKNVRRGVTGATSNPILIADIIKAGGVDELIQARANQGMDDPAIAWELTDHFVSRAQEVFLPVYQRTSGNDGYVSFELDPLLEDADNPVPHDQRVKRYVELARKWSAGHPNRMIKIPATAAGIASLEQVAAAGIPINVTLVFTRRQYELARDAVWRGAQKRTDGLDRFKSAYSIFVSRVDVYTQKHVPDLSPQAQGQVGIVNAKQIYALNRDFWTPKNLKLQQEIIFASTGAKLKGDAPDKYAAAFAGDGIETNPPETNDALEQSGTTYTRQIDHLPPRDVLDEIARKVDYQKLEDTLMEEGTKKFADPQKKLIASLKEKRAALQR